MRERIIQLLDAIPEVRSEKPDVRIIKLLVETIRPKRIKNCTVPVNEQFALLNDILESNNEYREQLKQYIHHIFRYYDAVPLYTELGILPATGFFHGLIKKIKYRMLPELYEENDLRKLLKELFNKRRDYLWIQKIDKIQLDRFLMLTEVLCHFSDKPMNNRSFFSMVSAIQILSHRIAALGTAPEILTKLPELDNVNSPFLQQNRSITIFLEQYKDRFEHNENDFLEIAGYLDKCAETLNDIYANKQKFGVNLRQTHIVKRITHQIARVRLLLNFVYNQGRTDFREKISLALSIFIKATNKRYNIGQHINDYLDLLIFEVIEHAAQSGKHYIAKNKKEYFHFLRASLGGGVIVALFAAMKLETHAWQVAPFVKALIYSLVYSGAFVAIYLTGAILATKLPAYTATRLAECVDPGSNNNVTADRFIETIVMLFRSQFVAFVGNLLAAIVVAIAIARLWVLAFPLKITSDYGATVLVKEINLLHTPTIFFAAIAGLYLFIGGLVTGHYENKLLFARIPERIRAIGEDERFGSKKRNVLIWLSKYIEHHMGKINGNVTMGFLFGFTVLIGYIFGFWLDVRHIAFASANIGFAIADNPEIFTTKVIIESTIALMIIGFVNFIVSFILALLLAVRSRKITYTDTRKLLAGLGQRFIKKPWSWFFP